MEKTEEIKRKITDELIDLGMPMHILGFDYWSYLIEYIYKYKLSTNNMMEIYEIVGKEFNTNPTRAERALRYAMEYVRENVREKYNIKSKITNESFIKLFILKVL